MSFDDSDSFALDLLQDINVEGKSYVLIFDVEGNLITIPSSTSTSNNRNI